MNREDPAPGLHQPLARRSALRALALLAAYAGLVIWLTWPLARHASTHLSDTGLGSRFDPLFDIWVLSHESHALVTNPA